MSSVILEAHDLTKEYRHTSAKEAAVDRRRIQENV